MRANTFIYLSLLLVFLVLQCVSPYQQGQEKTKVLSNELLKIRYVDIAPDTTVVSGAQLYIDMEVENVGQSKADLLILKPSDDKDDCKKVKKLLGSAGNGSGAEENLEENLGNLILYSYCTPLYKVSNFQILSPFDPNKDVKNAEVDLDFDGKLDKTCALEIEPGESAVFRWEIATPDEEATFGMIHECNFGFQIMYKSQANTTAYIYFARAEEIRQRSYNQQDLGLAGSNIATSGPLAAIVIAENQPYPVSEDNNKFVLALRLENRGKGIAKVWNLNIRYPEGFEVNKNKCKYFTDDGSRVMKMNTKDARKMLEIYGGKSSTLYCEFTVPAEQIKILKPFRFEVWADYVYSVQMEKKIKVIPPDRI